MAKTKTYMVIGTRKETYCHCYEATSKAEAVRMFEEDIAEGVDWTDSGRMTIRAVKECGQA